MDFKAKHGVDLASYPDNLSRLISISEHAKIEIAVSSSSYTHKSIVTIPGRGSVVHYDAEISNGKFEELC